MTRILWITGRAATGKTTLINELDTQLHGRGIPVHRWCDEEILYRLKAADVDHAHHWHPDNASGGFAPRSGHLFDEALRIISNDLTDLVHTGGDDIALVELARGRRHPIDVSYRRAAQLIATHLWTHSIVFRLPLPFSRQLARNHHRGLHTGHHTPETIMRELYRNDDPHAFLRAGIAVVNLPANTVPAVTARLILHLTDHNISGTCVSTTTTSADHA